MPSPLLVSSPGPNSTPGAPRSAIVAVAGTTAGSYRLERRIGAGGMGEVWLGRHVVSNGLGAVKLLGPKLSGSADAAVLFAREQRALLRLSHPHIVPVFEVGQRHIAMAYVEGASLARRLRAMMTPGDVFRVARQVASALAHAHAQRVLHLDVKPSNVLLDAAGNAFLVDFGAALLLDAEGERDAEIEVFGTPSYIAPERADGAAFGEAADQFALGRTIVAALLGTERLPPWGQEEAALPASLPAPARAVVARAIAVDPAHRFPSLAAFEEALAGCDLEGLDVRRAPLDRVRDAGPFAWAARPLATKALAPNIARADYAIETLEQAGLLPSPALASFRAATGLRTTGFSLYVHARLRGDDAHDVGDDAARPDGLARARHVVVLVPGYATKRDCWSELAIALVRDNPDTVVCTLDHSGFGDARFAAARPAPEHLGYAAVTRTILAWTTLVGLEEIPTVILGHSLAATGLFLLHDEAFGPHRARIALTPMFSCVYAKAPGTFWIRIVLALATVLFYVPGCYSGFFALLEAITGHMRDLTPAIRDAILAQSVQLSPAVHARLALRLGHAVPEQRGPLLRMYFALGATDPEARTGACERAHEVLGIRPERFRWLASGSHFPHLESVSSPEGTLRNRHEIVLLVDEALDDVSPARRATTEYAATLLT